LIKLDISTRWPWPHSRKHHTIGCANYTTIQGYSSHTRYLMSPKDPAGYGILRTPFYFSWTRSRLSLFWLSHLLLLLSSPRSLPSCLQPPAPLLPFPLQSARIASQNLEPFIPNFSRILHNQYLRFCREGSIPVASVQFESASSKLSSYVRLC